MWLPLALTAALLTSFLPIINKRLLADAPVAVVAWGVNALSLPILALAAIVLRPVPSVDGAFWLGVGASAGLNLVATLVSTQALKLGDASLVTPFLTFNPAFTLLVAALTIGETPGGAGVLGVALIAAGGYAFNLQQARFGWWLPLRAMVADRPVFLAILASFIWALTPIAEKIAIRHTDPANAPLVAFASTALMVLFLLPPALKRGQRPIGQIREHAYGFTAAALIAGVAPIFGFTAIQLGLVGYVSAIFKLSAVASVLWAALFLHETAIRERVAGAAIMVAGALLIAV